ncbi:MAG TPA: amidohydrolase [Actinomycetes bacterium]|nr:amidohydrolase [Actinomycetes bacterium]
MTRTLIVGGTLLTGDDNRPVIDDGYVAIEDSTITAVGDGRPKETGWDEVIEAEGMLVSPGFINAHTHLCMILGRTLGADRSLLAWLSESQVPLMLAFEPEDYRLSMELGAIENLKAGNTTVCEVFFSPHYDQEADLRAAEGLDRSGIRSVLFRCTNDEAFFEGFVETRSAIVERFERLIQTQQGSARTRVGLGPLVPWGSSAESFQDAVELSKQYGVGIHLHTAETPEYNALVQERTGMSNVEMLGDVGALGPQVMLNHCVFLSDHDIGLIAETGSNVIHDPTSNMLLASGIAPIPKVRAAGINLGLACDGPACNNGQDMIEAMKDAALLHKAVTRQPDVIVARDVFEMATRGGARAIGMGDTLGAIRPGLLADLVLIDTRVPHLTPMHDPLAALVYSARGSDVRTVIVGGEIVVEDGTLTTLDEEEVLARARERADRARRLAGV